MRRLLVALAAVALTVSACGGPDDPRRGLVTISNSNCLWGECWELTEICKGTTLVTAFNDGYSDHDELDHRIAERPEVQGDSMNRQQCAGTTLSGARCRRPAQGEAETCTTHTPNARGWVIAPTFAEPITSVARIDSFHRSLDAALSRATAADVDYLTGLPWYAVVEPDEATPIYSALVAERGAA